MKAALTEAYEVGGLTGVAMRERIRYKMANQFYSNPGNHRQAIAGLFLGALAGAQFAVLTLIFFSKWFVGLRAGLYVLRADSMLNEKLIFALSSGIVIGYVFLFAITVYYAVAVLGNVVRRLDGDAIRRANEEVEL